MPEEGFILNVMLHENCQATLPGNMSVVSNYSEIDHLIRNRCGNASWNHLKFTTFTPEDAKRWPEMMYKTSSRCDENRAEIHDFGAKGVPKSTKNCAWERFERDLGSKSVLGPPQNASATPFCISFGRYWAPFWAPLGTKGS